MLGKSVVTGIAALLLAAGQSDAASAQERVLFRPASNSSLHEIEQAAAETANTNPSLVIPFLEGTDVFWTVQKDTARGGWFPYILEANIFPHLVGLQSFTDVINIDKQQERAGGEIKEFSYSISGTPGVRLRMLRQESAPVRTPSYMPRGNLQFLWVRDLKKCASLSPSTTCRDSLAVAPLADSAVQPRTLTVLEALQRVARVSIWEAHFIVGHHSNGQEGCSDLTQSRDPPDVGPCRPPAQLTAGTLNRINGGFSTSYLRVGINYSRNWLDDGPLLPAVREARLRADWEYHPRAWVDPDIIDRFGRSRWNLEATLAAAHVRFCRRRIEGIAGLSWNPGHVTGVRPVSFSAQMSCHPVRNGGWGHFVRVYHGEDYYNVHFVDNITRLQFGATFSQSGFFRLRRQPPPAR